MVLAEACEEKVIEQMIFTLNILSNYVGPLTVADLSSTPNNGTKMRISFKVLSFDDLTIIPHLKVRKTKEKWLIR